MTIDLSVHESDFNRKPKKVTKKFIKKFWKTIKNAYPGDQFPKNASEAKKHVFGDVLANFVILEISDAIEEEEYASNAIVSSIKSMTMAINDLKAVRESLVELLVEIGKEEFAKSKF